MATACTPLHAHLCSGPNFKAARWLPSLTMPTELSRIARCSADMP